MKLSIGIDIESRSFPQCNSVHEAQFLVANTAAALAATWMSTRPILASVSSPMSTRSAPSRSAATTAPSTTTRSPASPTSTRRSTEPSVALARHPQRLPHSVPML